MIPPSLSRLPRSLFATLLCLSPVAAVAQNYIDLNFSQNVQHTDGVYPNLSILGPHYYSGSTFDFSNVATVNGQSVDARVSVVGTAGDYEFVGWLPGFNGPDIGDFNYPDNGISMGDDLGVYYRFNGTPSPDDIGGMRFCITFYEGGGLFETEQVLPDFRFLIYDHDGESMQSEHIRTYVEDGFVGYQLHNDSGITAHDEGSAWRFDARGHNHSELTAEGGFIAYYQNTSSIRFDLFASTTDGPVDNYGVFTAFNGNLSLTGGSTSDFTPYASIPEPSSPLLIATATLLGISRRSRP